MEAAASAPIPELLQGDAHNLINVILARTRALRQASLAARRMTSPASQARLQASFALLAPIALIGLEREKLALSLRSNRLRYKSWK